MGIKAPYPPSPTPLRVPMSKGSGLRESGHRLRVEVSNQFLIFERKCPGILQCYDCKPLNPIHLNPKP